MNAYCERSDCNPETCPHSSHRRKSVAVKWPVVILATHCVACGEDGDLLPNGKHPECDEAA
jgi:hypothetical protein